MEGLVSILNFDQVYQTQKFFHNIDYEWIELSDIKNTNRYCETQSLEIINKRLNRRKNKGIAFIGSGNYHYVTYLFMLEIQKPFTLILFDHHSDMIKPVCKSLISCGSWVLEALEDIPMLKKVIIVGVGWDYTEFIYSYINEDICVFSNNYILEEESIEEDIVSQTPTNQVYLSIDKDVLDESEALVNWDQGSMKLEQLIEIIQYIYNHKRICGIDICGEYPITPSESFLQKSLKAT